VAGFGAFSVAVSPDELSLLMAQNRKYCTLRKMGMIQLNAGIAKQSCSGKITC
jgi:hypothetical protein